MPSFTLGLRQTSLEHLSSGVLAFGPEQAWAISECRLLFPSEMPGVQQSSLHPALHCPERRGRVKSRWTTTGNNRHAKYCELAATGRDQLEAEEKSEWKVRMASPAQISETT